jgi:hypothetical protein
LRICIGADGPGGISRTLRALFRREAGVSWNEDPGRLGGSRQAGRRVPRSTWLAVERTPDRLARMLCAAPAI